MKLIPIMVLSCLSYIVYADSSEPPMDLPLTTSVNNGRTSSTAVLESLKEDVLYRISCQINATEDNDGQILLEPRLLSTDSYSNVQLNGKELPYNAGDIKEGLNTLSFELLINKADTEQYNRFSLSSPSESSIEVNQCTALATSVDNEKAKGKMKSFSSGGGYFTAYNDTSSVVTISVGNFFPTPYTIYPFDWRLVYVSTDNQNIHIKRVD